jgi:hypothetical protein
MTHLFSIPTLLNGIVSPFVRSDLITYTNPDIRIPSYINNLIAVGEPVILVVVVGIYRNSLHELHHGLLAAISGRFVVPHDKNLSIALIIYSSLSRVITEALKNRIGKLWL